MQGGLNISTQLTSCADLKNSSPDLLRAPSFDMPIQLLPRSCLETQVFEGETLTILDTVEKVINALGMTNPTPVDADNNIADRSPAPRAVRTVMYGVVR